MAETIETQKTTGPDRSGRSAGNPTAIPMRGWFKVLKRVKKQVDVDNVAIVSAGVAFYFFLSLFPILAAIVSVYGLVTDPATVERQIAELTGILPEKLNALIGEVARNLASTSPGKLEWGVALSLLFSLWSASKGSKALVKGVNIAYNETERRGFFRRIVLSLVFTVVGLGAAILALVLVAGVPAVTGMFNLPSTLTIVLVWLRWPLLTALVMVLLAGIYRYAPARERAEWKWLSVGSVVAVGLWLLSSALFSYYVDNFSNYEGTYGSFAGVVILMLWFFVTAFLILLGAEINSELEHQTAQDTTVGPDEPMGERGAYYADNVAK